MSTKEIVDNAVGQLSTTLASVTLQLHEMASKIGSEAEAAEFIKAVKFYEDCLPRDTIKEVITDLAVKFQIGAYLGDYGNGESLCLYASDWDGTSPGDWVSSSDNC
jgi:hypothetical protein